MTDVCLIHGLAMEYDFNSGFELCPECERQAMTPTDKPSQGTQQWLASITPRPEIIAVTSNVWGIRHNGQMVCAPTIEEAVNALRAAQQPTASEPSSVTGTQSKTTENILRDVGTVTRAISSAEDSVAMSTPETGPAASEPACPVCGEDNCELRNNLLHKSYG